MDELDAVADRLYGLPPADFTAARDAAAKQTGSKEQRAAVKGLRRPSVSAWVVNLLAREQGQLLEQLLDLGPALAQAQQDGQGDALRTLGQQRRQLVGAVTGTAVGLAERTVGAQVRTEVEQTLEAALADPRAAEAVRSGRLVRSLSYAGLGDVDVDGAVAVQGAVRAAERGGARGATQRPARPEACPATGPAIDLAELERSALDAAAVLDDAVRACEHAEIRREQAERRQTSARDAATRTAQELQQIEERLAAAREGELLARQDAQTADQEVAQSGTDAEHRRRAVADAQAAAQQARSALDRARRGD